MMNKILSTFNKPAKENFHKQLKQEDLASKNDIEKKIDFDEKLEKISNKHVESENKLNNSITF